jgi:hypothetical protein
MSNGFTVDPAGLSTAAFTAADARVSAVGAPAGVRRFRGFALRGVVPESGV